MGKIDDLLNQNRQYTQATGGQLMSGAQEQANNNAGLSANYRQIGDEANWDRISGRGGYTPGEAGNITRDDELHRAVSTNEDFDRNFLTGDEYNQIMGNPWQRGAYFNPDGSRAMQDASAGRQRGAADALHGGMAASYNPADLAMSGGYGDTVRGALGSTRTGVQGALDPTRMRADAGALSRMRMSPEEQQRIVTGAGITAGNHYQNEIGDLDRRAMAANMDPAGVAAMRDRMERHSAEDAGDAMTQARIGASNAAAAREGSAESMRIGAEQGYAGQAAGSQLALGNQAIGAAGQLEGTRLGANRDIADRGMDVARTGGLARLNTEGQINAQDRNVDQFGQQLGTQIATGAEQDSAARAAALAANRQQTQRGNSDTRFAQGYAENNALSGRYQNVANTRLSEMNHGLDYITSQNQQANNNANFHTGIASGIFNTQGGQNLGNTQQAMQQDMRPSWWQQLLGGVTGIAGAAGGLMTGIGGLRNGPTSAAAPTKLGYADPTPNQQLAAKQPTGPQGLPPAGGGNDQGYADPVLPDSGMDGGGGQQGLPPAGGQGGGDYDPSVRRLSYSAQGGAMRPQVAGPAQGGYSGIGPSPDLGAAMRASGKYPVSSQPQPPAPSPLQKMSAPPAPTNAAGGSPGLQFTPPQGAAPSPAPSSQPIAGKSPAAQPAATPTAGLPPPPSAAASAPAPAAPDTGADAAPPQGYGEPTPISKKEKIGNGPVFKQPRSATLPVSYAA